MNELIIYLLLVQAIVGGFDTLYNHEYLLGLPDNPDAQREIGLHSIRETSYGIFFISVSWFSWHGLLIFAPIALFIFLVMIDVFDEWAEDQSRILPKNERALHFAMTMLLGIIALIGGRQLIQNFHQESSLEFGDLNILVMVITGLAMASIGWGIRDYFAWRKLSKINRLAN